MRDLTAKVFASMVLAAVLYSDGFAYSDPQLKTIRDAFGARRDGMLASQVSSPYPDPCAPGADAVWGLQDYALSVLYRLNSTPTQLASANGAIINACAREKADPTYTNLSTESFHWRGNLFFRLYKYFSHDAADPNFRGRLTPAAEAAICDVFWNYAKWNSKVADTDIAATKTWYIWGSENHGAMRYTTNYSAAAILKNVAPYNTYTYNDGKTALQHYNAWNTYFKEYLRERAKRGLLVEIGSHTYCKYTTQGWYNFYDFAEDQNLARLGGMVLDLWWADWAHEQFNGVRGGGKARIYQGPDGADLHPADDAAYAMCWYYFGFGTPSSGHPGVMCLATSKYRLPLVVMDIALDAAGKGAYEYKSRRPGLLRNPYPTGVPSDTSALDPNYGGIYRYTYATPSFVLGSLMLEKRNNTDWAGFSDQNRWQGVIFNTHVEARIIPQCVGTGNYKTYNQHWSVQNKGTMIIQKLTTSTQSGAMRVYFSKSPMRFNAVNEESGWVFVDAGQSYAAVRPATNTYSWDDPNWMKMSNQYAAVIIEVAESKDYADFTAFKTAVKALPLSVVGSVVTYTGLKDNGTFTFYTDYSQLPKVNGVAINLKPSFTFDSPFMHEDWATGNVTIHKSGRTCTLDFNDANKVEIGCGQWGYLNGDLNYDCLVDMNDIKIIADNWLAFDNWLGEITPLPPYEYGPFTDSTTTVALWNMDSIYTGADGIRRVADDDSVKPDRNNNLKLGLSPGYAVSTQPTTSFPDPGYNNQGACLYFDGIDDECGTDISWAGYDSVVVDAWIYPMEGAGSNVIVEATSTWSLGIGNNVLGFTTWHPTAPDGLSWPSAIAMNTWHHVRAICTSAGKKYLTLDGTTFTSSPNQAITLQTKGITMGNKPGTGRYFQGYIDEVRIATIDPQGYRSGTVNLRDFAILAQDWLKCTDPANSACEHGF